MLSKQFLVNKMFSQSLILSTVWKQFIFPPCPDYHLMYPVFCILSVFSLTVKQILLGFGDSHIPWLAQSPAYEAFCLIKPSKPSRY